MGSITNTKFLGLGNVGAQVLDLLEANFHFILFQDLMDSSSRHAHIEEDYALHGLSRNDPILTPSKDFTFKDGYMSSIMGITQKELLFFFIRFCNIVHHWCPLKPMWHL